MLSSPRGQGFAQSGALFEYPQSIRQAPSSRNFTFLNLIYILTTYFKVFMEYEICAIFHLFGIFRPQRIML